LAASSLTPVPFTTYDFRYRQTINVAYATLERPLGGLSAQLGLRLENASLDVRELASRLRNRPNDLGVFPTLHLTYKLDDQHKLSASYTERIQRPPPFLLNPFRVYVNPKTYQEGNPNLRPRETQSFELGYERRKDQVSYQATAYYRNNKGEFSLILRDQGDGVLVIIYDNLGSSRTAGLELVANGKLSKSLAYSANANLFWKEINAANLGAADSRSTYGVGGRLNLDWQARRDDLLQLSLSVQGKQIVAQGIVRPITTLNLGWRHKLTDRVTATLSAQDLLNTNSFRRTFDTPTLRDRYDYWPVSRAITLRLDYRFGGKGKPAREPGFEYESAGQAAP
jgi:outer membrane receptor protein involved in Fe transport